MTRFDIVRCSSARRTGVSNGKNCVVPLMSVATPNMHPASKYQANRDDDVAQRKNKIQQLRKKVKRVSDPIYVEA